MSNRTFYALLDNNRLASFDTPSERDAFVAAASAQSITRREAEKEAASIHGRGTKLSHLERRSNFSGEVEGNPELICTGR